LSDEFFSTFLNDIAFVKTFLISGRRASKRWKRWEEKGFSRNRWSFYFNGSNNALPPDLIKKTAVRILFHLEIEEMGEGRREERKKCACWSRADLGGRFPRFLLYYFLCLFCTLNTTIITLRMHPRVLRSSRPPRWRRQLDEIFIETPVDYSDARCARANSRDCEFIWWCNRRRDITLEPRAEIFSNIKVFAPKMKFGRRGRADANKINTRWVPLSWTNDCDRKEMSSYNVWSYIVTLHFDVHTRCRRHLKTIFFI